MINETTDSGGAGGVHMPDELLKMVSLCFAEGVSHGIQTFLVTNNVNLQPTKDRESPLRDFLISLMSEFAETEEQKEFAKQYPYPFKDSIREAIQIAMNDVRPELMALWDNKETQHIEQLCRVVGVGETLLFLDKHRIEVIKFINDLRKE